MPRLGEPHALDRYTRDLAIEALAWSFDEIPYPNSNFYAPALTDAPFWADDHKEVIVPGASMRYFWLDDWRVYP